MLVRELKAADWAGAVVVKPLADAAGAESVLAGQLQYFAASLEVLQADLALFQCLLLPCCVLYTPQTKLSLAKSLSSRKCKHSTHRQLQHSTTTV